MNILEAELSELHLWYPLWKAQEDNTTQDYSAGDVYLVMHTYQRPNLRSTE